MRCDGTCLKLVRPFWLSWTAFSAHCRVVVFDQRTVTRLPVATKPAAPPCGRRGPRAMPVERNQVVVCYRSPYERIAGGGLPDKKAAADSRLQLGPAQPGSPAMLLAGLRQRDGLCEVRLRGGWLPPQLPLHGGAAADRRTGEPHPRRARTEGEAAGGCSTPPTCTPLQPALACSAPSQLSVRFATAMLACPCRRHPLRPRPAILLAAAVRGSRGGSPQAAAGHFLPRQARCCMSFFDQHALYRVHSCLLLPPASVTGPLRLPAVAAAQPPA